MTGRGARLGEMVSISKGREDEIAQAACNGSGAESQGQKGCILRWAEEEPTKEPRRRPARRSSSHFSHQMLVIFDWNWNMI